MSGYRSTATLLGEILPVVGTIGLLGLWLYQQTAVERRSEELRKLATGRSVYQLYQSHNALFNSILELVKDEKAQSQVRRFQMYNYELGLAGIEDALPAAQKADLPPRADPYDGMQPVDVQMDLLQKRLTVIQEKLLAEAKSIRASADAARQLSLWGYIVLSVVGIAGTVLKAIDKFI